MNIFVRIKYSQESGICKLLEGLSYPYEICLNAYNPNKYWDVHNMKTKDLVAVARSVKGVPSKGINDSISIDIAYKDLLAIYRGLE